MLFAGLGMVLVTCVQTENIEDRKPNILFLLADDMGYGELGSYGQKIIQTPVLDDLAKRGMRFTDFYVTSGVCTPSRSSIMTGCYPRRVNMHVDEKGGQVLRAVARKVGVDGVGRFVGGVSRP